MAQLHCDVTIMRLANLDFDLPPGDLFVRYYVFVGRGRRIRIDTRPIPSTSEPCWDAQASFECWGSANIVSEVIDTRSIVFELRWRRQAAPVWGKMVRSKLLGRGEVKWRDAMDSADMAVEKWVRFGKKSGASEFGLKPHALLVKMGIRVKVPDVTEKKTVGRQRLWKECNCESCGWVGSEEDMFLAATAASMTDAR